MTVVRSGMPWTPTGITMICLDVNVLVHVTNQASDRHEVTRDWLGNVLASPEALIIPDAVTTRFIRLVTSPRVMPSPLHPDQAFALIDWLLDHPSTMSISGDARTRSAFRHLVQSLALRGNDVSDAWIAATAIASNSMLATFDRGFRRFPGVRVFEPAV